MPSRLSKAQPKRGFVHRFFLALLHLNHRVLPQNTGCPSGVNPVTGGWRVIRRAGRVPGLPGKPR